MSKKWNINCYSLKICVCVEYMKHLTSAVYLLMKLFGDIPHRLQCFTVKAMTFRFAFLKHPAKCYTIMWVTPVTHAFSLILSRSLVITPPQCHLHPHPNTFTKSQTNVRRRDTNFDLGQDVRGNKHYHHTPPHGCRQFESPRDNQ